MDFRENPARLVPFKPPGGDGAAVGAATGLSAMSTRLCCRTRICLSSRIGSSRADKLGNALAHLWRCSGIRQQPLAGRGPADGNAC